ncbi:uncharacterized protein BP5553_07051 [Venustampulla echinocandica]|uniref:Uncharacterized protein n=1 Tax=Venustampulla echinocandica TaxID=2656787 RepID=A0A370TIF1_9HELO|nr:uncharacterized protein BP5553_07051 [Venustampulla echinocandica]RDL35120.1 hypothetical protein BP5553_07051 [Venustampulla echinocandica]
MRPGSCPGGLRGWALAWSSLEEGPATGPLGNGAYWQQWQPATPSPDGPWGLGVAALVLVLVLEVVATAKSKSSRSHLSREGGREEGDGMKGLNEGDDRMDDDERSSPGHHIPWPPRQPAANGDRLDSRETKTTRTPGSSPLAHEGEGEGEGGRRRSQKQRDPAAWAMGFDHDMMLRPPRHRFALQATCVSHAGEAADTDADASEG